MLREPGILGSPGPAAEGRGRGAAGAARRGLRHLRGARPRPAPPQEVGGSVGRSVCLSSSVTLSVLGARCRPLGVPSAPPPATCPLSWRTWRLASGYFSRWGGGRGEDTTYPPNYAQARLCFPLQINFKEQTAGPGGKEAGEERGNGLGTAAAKRVKFRAQSRLVHAPAAQHLPGVWRTRCSTSLPCYPKLIDDGFPARLYLTERCGELL